uniref:Uncharacterized protein n=1 Tax=Anguilla anguilla TaxID=7936 RepID=A0A0E9U7P4_ANGAN
MIVHGGNLKIVTMTAHDH